MNVSAIDDWSRRALLTGAMAALGAESMRPALAQSAPRNLTPASDLPVSGGVRYVRPEQSRLPFPRVMITQQGASLESVDCSGCYVSIHASDVVLRGCLFTVTEGVAVAVDCYDGASNVTVEQCHFDGLKKDTPSEPVLRVRDGSLFARGCLFENLPSDGITLVAGVVEQCVFRGSGFLSGAHADAIWVPRTVGPIVIRDNDIDWRKPPDAKVIPNTAVQVVPEMGDISGVLIERNRCRGGSYTIQVSGHPLVGDKFKLGGVVVRDNLLSDWVYGPLYPMLKPADLKFENNRQLTTGALLSGAPQAAR